MRINPINGNVILKPVIQDDIATIYLTDKKSDIETGIVISASQSDFVLVGDKVLYYKYSASKIDDSYSIIKEKDILGIVE